MNFAIYQASRIGGRQYNQDRAAYAYSDQSLLLVLADGMGGHLYGEIAAQLTIQIFVEAFERRALPRVENPVAFLRDTMQAAHAAIIDYALTQRLGGNPGTTCAVALIQDGKACWAHAGDSRIYVLRDGKVVDKSHDHSMVQQWADWGIIPVDEMRTHPDRNKITNCLGGVGDMFFVESSVTMPLQQGDILLLCSDGFWGPLTDMEMAAELTVAPRAAQLNLALEHLMTESVTRSGTGADNTTAIVARWGDNEKAHSSLSPVIAILDCLDFHQ